MKKQKCFACGDSGSVVHLYCPPLLRRCNRICTMVCGNLQSVIPTSAIRNNHLMQRRILGEQFQSLTQMIALIECRDDD